MALSLSPRLLVGALAAIVLASCSDEAGKSDVKFTPVPVTPVIGDVALGSDTASITVVEYAAFTCPHCRDFWKWDFPKLKANYIDTGKIRYVYRDFPLEADAQTGAAVDGFGVLLASVARCAGKEKYYDMVDGIFSAQADLMDAARTGGAGPVIASVAEKQGLTRDQTRTCIDFQPELNASIKKSRDDAAAKGVKSIPSVFINDEMLPNPTIEVIIAAIEAKLAGGAAAATTPAPPTPPAPQPSPAAPPASPPS